jgi:hypothetical protein
VSIYADGTLLGEVTLETLQPYASHTAQIAGVNAHDPAATTYEVVFSTEGKEIERNTFARK